jgi:hypothetical protein
LIAVLLLLLASLCHTDRIRAQNLDSLRASLLLPAGLNELRDGRHLRLPVASIQSPTAFGAEYGDVFAGAAFQKRTRFTRTKDAMVAVGAGLGNRSRTVGVELTLTSFSTLRQGFGTNGSISIKAHRIIAPATAVAVGYENAVRWGVPDGGQSLYAVGSTFLPLRSNAASSFGGIGINFGVANGRFRSEHDVDSHTPNANIFGTLTTRVTSQALLIADWAGQDLAVATAIQPLQRVPVVVTIGAADVLHRAGDGARFIAGAGAVWRWR